MATHQVCPAMLLLPGGATGFVVTGVVVGTFPGGAGYVVTGLVMGCAPGTVMGVVTGFIIGGVVKGSVTTGVSGLAGLIVSGFGEGLTVTIVGVVGVFPMGVMGKIVCEFSASF